MKTLMLTLILFTSFGFQSDFQLSKSAIKKINHSIEEIWNGSEITRELIQDNKYHIEKLSLNHKIVGFMVVGQAPSKFMQFDYMIIYNENMEIMESQILVYREEYGGEISSKRWLRQFVGLNNQSEMKLSSDIVGISGATISCNSATVSFKQATSHMTRKFNIN